MMNSKVTFALGLFIGAGIGALTTRDYFKDQYEQLAQKDFEDRRRCDKDARKAADNDKDSRNEQTEAIIDIVEEAKKLGEFVSLYGSKPLATDISSYSKNSKKEDKKMDKPYVITPDEFGEIDDYERISLVYYLDGVLVDDNNDVIRNADEVIGLSSLNHFGEYEDDSVFVRNDILKADYEILLDQRDYSDVLKTLPPKMEE